MRLSGLADECAASIEDQIGVHRLLGWSELELRTIDNTPLADLGDAAIDAIADALRTAGMTVTALCSRIGGWQRSVDTPRDVDLAELRRLAFVADRVGCRRVRIMSYPNVSLSQAQWRNEAIARVRELTAVAEEEGLLLLHENCVGWASQGPDETVALLDAIASDALRLLFDAGNPLYYGQDGPAFLARVLPWIEHVHVKDARRDADGRTVATFPGDGEAQLREMAGMLLRGGYRGAWSIEPHIDSIPHDRTFARGEDVRDRYVAYGRAFAALLQHEAERAC